MSRTLTVREEDRGSFDLRNCAPTNRVGRSVGMNVRVATGVEEVEVLLYNVKKLIGLSSVERLGPQAGMRNQVALQNNRCLMPQEKVVEVGMMNLRAWNVIPIRNIIGETWGDESGTDGGSVLLW